MNALGLAALAGLVLAAPEPAAPVVIGSYPIDRAQALAAHRIELELVNYSGSRYGELSRRKALERHGALLAIDLRKLDAPPRDRPARAHRRCSFAVDCEEPSVVRAAQELVKRYGAQATPQAIERFVDEFIVKKSLAYGMTPASTVASAREGDCTEHAMLFTALARRAGYAARFVSGLVLLKPRADSQTLLAYGHAWAEVYEEKRWRRYDPALRLVRGSGATSSVPLACLVYVPTRLLDDEGPAFPGTGGFDSIFVKAVRVSAEFGARDHCP